jgi:hypothetical protein
VNTSYDDIIKDFLTCFEAKDADRLASFLHPDVVFLNYGDPEVMTLDDVELPAPGAGEALVDVAISGVNFMDCREAQDGRIGASLRCETAPRPAYAKRLLHRVLRPDRLAVTL